jgi:hypothetical protein
MENLNEVNWKVRQRELMDSLNEDLEPINKYSTVWIQYTRLYSVCITVFSGSFSGKVFPDPGYRMYFAKNVQDWSLENLRNIVLSQIEK